MGVSQLPVGLTPERRLRLGGTQLFHIQGPNGPELVVGAGEKSGVYWGRQRGHGEQILWGTHRRAPAG